MTISIKMSLARFVFLGYLIIAINSSPMDNVPECPPQYYGLLVHPDDCRLYVRCTNGVASRVQSCPDGTVFDVSTYKCDKSTDLTFCEHPGFIAFSRGKRSSV